MTQQSDIVIVGGGIVGSALAYFLSSSSEQKITLVERSFGKLKGSTGYAPGFIGQFNESEVLTRLAIDSVEEYTKIPNGFDHVGGLEIAASKAGVERLQWRLESARERGLEGELISAQKAAQMAPDLVKGDNKQALYFPSDGTANPTTITAFFQSEAAKKGVELVEGNVTEIRQGDGKVEGVNTTAGYIEASKVVLATGIWAQNLCDFGIPIPIIPVAHPYMYGEHHEPKAYKSPFVRYPEHHVYVRDHGSFFGLGSYDHKPLAERPEDKAVGGWVGDFDRTLDRALQFIPEKTKLAPREKFNGIFSMTPDNMPLVGSIPEVEGLYMAAAVWVTHAAGSAKFLTKMLSGEDVDEAVRKALDPTRFVGQDSERLERESLNCYNSIYSTHESSS
ncbi:NAD(P)/FAD-dependent oxidoreductase [Aspergillus stella-maris]|uniref:NAD(P)/FAD-dependent oxidoreductase n=1 Tax=Aspergillus stella-maris TaxID=1810926 RepID=UPI003CCD7822